MGNINICLRESTRGLYIYNGYTSLIYHIHQSESQQIKNWILNKGRGYVELIYEKTIGAGWHIPIEDSDLSISQILPSSEKWKNDIPNFPLTINWLLTGSCPLNCTYCYAEDLMRKNVENPTQNDIIKIAQNILTLNPLVVVLTGGDPLVSPHLITAIKLLKGKTGVLLDTSGYTFSDKIAEICKENNVGVRISLDSIDWTINNTQRPLKNLKHQRKRKDISRELAAIKLTLDKEIPLIVQTVLTPLNYDYIIELGDYLNKLGVKVWRIQLLQRPSEKIIKSEYKIFQGSQGKNHDYLGLIQQLKFRSFSVWGNSMSIKFTENRTANRNSVILVSPEGKFFTEGNESKGKILIDSENPYSPSSKSLKKFINHSGHLMRYLNIECNEKAKTNSIY